MRRMEGGPNSRADLGPVGVEYLLAVQESVFTLEGCI